MRLIALLRPCRQLSLHLTSSPRLSPCRLVFLFLASSSSSSFIPFYPLLPLVISLALRLVARAISALEKWPLHTSSFWTGPPVRCGTQRQSGDTENVCRYDGRQGETIEEFGNVGALQPIARADVSLCWCLSEGLLCCVLFTGLLSHLFIRFVPVPLVCVDVW